MEKADLQFEIEQYVQQTLALRFLPGERIDKIHSYNEEMELPMKKATRFQTIMAPIFFGLSFLPHTLFFLLFAGPCALRTWVYDTNPVTQGVYAPIPVYDFAKRRIVVFTNEGIHIIDRPKDRQLLYKVWGCIYPVYRSAKPEVIAFVPWRKEMSFEVVKNSTNALKHVEKDMEMYPYGLAFAASVLVVIKPDSAQSAEYLILAPKPADMVEELNRMKDAYGTTPVANEIQASTIDNVIVIEEIQKQV